MVSAAVRSKVVILLLLIHCLLFLPLYVGRTQPAHIVGVPLLCASWGVVFGPCFVMQCLVSFLVLQPSRWGRLVTLL